MPEEIKVHVVDYGRKNLVLRYMDPMTEKFKTKSAETKNRKEAEKAAARWEAELRSGNYKVPSRISWEDFRERYENEHVTALSTDTMDKVNSVFNVFERIVSPKKLTKVTADRISYYQAELRRLGRSEQTIKSHMRHLKAALSWARQMQLIPEIPEIRMPPRAKRINFMKGRPLSQSEFDQMLTRVDEMLESDCGESWKFLLRGLWHSGLRLGEAMNLTWNDQSKIWISFSHRNLMLMIPAEMEKGNQDRQLPVTPDFAELLNSVSSRDRIGFVFNPRSLRSDHSTRLTHDQVGRIISQIGKEAGIVVSERAGKVKYASAHDLRRSFGERWSTRVPAQVLMQMMRHESIDTTLKYYVGRNAEVLADAIYSSVR
ncbi:MAG: site-specific integrase [Planctomycetaceae bacterium]